LGQIGGDGDDGDGGSDDCCGGVGCLFPMIENA
jgi:hypothetical protein